MIHWVSDVSDVSDDALMSRAASQEFRAGAFAVPARTDVATLGLCWKHMLLTISITDSG